MLNKNKNKDIDDGVQQQGQSYSAIRQDHQNFQEDNQYDKDNENNYDERQIDEDGPIRIDNIDHQQLLTDKVYNECFPFSARTKHLLTSLVCCRKRDVSYVSSIKQQGKVDFTEEDKVGFKKKIVELKIEETNQLELDKNLMHPFVKVHIVDINKGYYIDREDYKEACLVKNEDLTYYKEGAELQEEEGKLLRGGMGEWRKSYLKYIPPFATNCCDLRINGNSKATWNHSIIINEPATTIFDTDTVILFEILDFNAKFLRNMDSGKIDKDNYYRVAWGYLRPIGLAGNHCGKVKVQLYKYVFQSQKLPDNQYKCYVPLVYFDFIWPQKTEYDGHLQVTLNPIAKPYKTITTDYSRHIFQEERGKMKDLRKSQVEDGPKIEGDQQTEADKKRARRIRNKNERCYIPDRVLCKFESAPLGCFRLEFSYRGRYLAAACTDKSSRTFIRIFEVEQQMKEVFRYRGHQNLIHELSWSENDQYLVSSSSDFSAKVWKVPKEINDYIDEEQSEAQFLLSTLNHPSYVYSAKFHPKSNAGQLMIATACFDAKVRVFFVSTKKRGINQSEPQSFQIISSKQHGYDDFDNLLSHRHPNSLAFDSHGQLYVGDSLGTVHKFSLTNVKDNANKFYFISKIENKSIEGDPINQIHFLQPDSLIVHSRDNCLRKFDINHKDQTQSITASYIGSKTHKFPIHSRVSPDGQFLLAGSEDGKPYLWDISGNLESLSQLEYSIEGQVSDVSWSHGYHMIAVAGFSSEFPIIVYYFEKDANIIEQEHNYYVQQQKQREQDTRKYDADEMDHYQNYDPYDPQQANQRSKRRF